ncbi:unnamed protein product [Rotaria sp. Silwood1]|nr:unnamed protein product [Rotaria sp. Silwood1]CAF0765245.1 unnamed protein product [Rotaria sp. Silwood1]CAF3336050.1 unnamed protein product [Rotaria sp. Silwood1]CAF3343567.1 unnamed protein product [Rotaria sp. Silwood1]CAF4755008.1 unnamed protein product [Rotaria sp. Silwood1]
MSVPPSRPYPPRQYPSIRPTFIPKAPLASHVDAGLGAGAAAGGLAGLIGGLSAPLLCFGCLSAIALLGLFATMIGAAAYMNSIQRQIRQNAQGAGTMIELNLLVLLCALLCSMYVWKKNRRGGALSY